jgi:uncharacterized protein YqeY
MSNIKEQIQNDLKNAMKEKNRFKRDTLRFLMSSIKQVEIDTRKTLKDEDIIKIIQKNLKQRNEAAKQYKDGGREDLAQKELKEIEILEKYLPEQIDEKELKEKVKEIISKVNAVSLKDLGKVMKEAMKELGKVADGKRINKAAKELLN